LLVRYFVAASGHVDRWNGDPTLPNHSVKSQGGLGKLESFVDEHAPPYCHQEKDSPLTPPVSAAILLDPASRL